ncbi:MAG: thioredoxin fold domain-containing protein [Pseudomonadales bacterium]|nr:thioredoxin fold domain-containing protein [Pseudomonadales bacterium]
MATRFNAMLTSSLLTIVLIAGCGETEKPAGSAAVTPAVPESSHSTGAHQAEITWFDGSVDEAFTLAKTTGKPVYLYWGAVWCPPCQEIKHTVFKSPQFIAQSELFVPVYLDGDTERAQAWGEKFGVKGYPTMIVFSPAGEEVTRIPGGIDISAYTTVLQLSLDHMRPTAQLVQAALKDPTSLTASDLQQLAYYSWGQDFNALPEGTDPILFEQLSNVAKEPKVSSRLYMQYLLLAADAASEADDEVVVKRVDPARLQSILSEPALVVASWDYLAYWSEEIRGLLAGTEAEVLATMNQWADAMLANRHHPDISTAEQLGGWLPYVFLHKAESQKLADTESATPAPLPADKLQALKADGEQANKITRNAFARQSVISQLSYLYQQAGLADEARSLLIAELEISKSPYYFMSSLSSMAESDGNIEEALSWRKQAYETSTGPATRFQWGANYVRTLIRLTPEDGETITATTMKLFDDLQGMEETFAGRNFRVLRSMSRALEAWDDEYNEEASMLTAFRGRIQNMCSQQDADSLESTNCASLLASGETSTAATTGGAG